MAHHGTVNAEIRCGRSVTSNETFFWEMLQRVALVVRLQHLRRPHADPRSEPRRIGMRRTIAQLFCECVYFCDLWPSPRRRRRRLPGGLWKYPARSERKLRVSHWRLRGELQSRSTSRRRAPEVRGPVQRQRDRRLQRRLLRRLLCRVQWSIPELDCKGELLGELLGGLQRQVFGERQPGRPLGGVRGACKASCDGECRRELRGDATERGLPGKMRRELRGRVQGRGELRLATSTAMRNARSIPRADVRRSARSRKARCSATVSMSTSSGACEDCLDYLSTLRDRE